MIVGRPGSLEDRPGEPLGRPLLSEGAPEGPDGIPDEAKLLSGKLMITSVTAAVPLAGVVTKVVVKKEVPAVVEMVMGPPLPGRDSPGVELAPGTDGPLAPGADELAEGPLKTGADEPLTGEVAEPDGRLARLLSGTLTITCVMACVAPVGVVTTVVVNNWVPLVTVIGPPLLNGPLTGEVSEPDGRLARLL